MDRSTQKKSFPIPAVLAGVFALFVGLTLFLAMRSDFQTDIGHFAVGSPLVIAFIAGCAASAVLAAVLAFAAGQKGRAEAVPYSFVRKVTSICTAAAAAVLFVVVLWSELLTPGRSVPSVISLVTMPGLVAFYALGAFPGKIRAWVGIAACLSANFMLFRGYFDFTLPLNSPIRNAIAVMEAAFLLFLLSEMRSLLGRGMGVFGRFASFAAVSLMGGIALGLGLAMTLSAGTVPDGVSFTQCVFCFLAAADAFVGMISDGRRG